MLLFNYETDPHQRMSAHDLKEMFPDMDFSEYEDHELLDVIFNMYGEPGSVAKASWTVE